MGARWLKRLYRNPSLLIGLTLTLAVLAVAVLAPYLTAQSPTDMDTAKILMKPSAAHVLGTDSFGRDTYSRVLYGARISVAVGLLVMTATAVTGVLLGVLAGYYRRLDGPIMRAMDLLMALPAILLALGVMAILGPRLINVVISLAVVYTPQTARVVRGAVIAAREQEFVEAARALGSGDTRLLWRHVLPSTLGPLIVQQTSIFAYAVLAEATLSFLGVGVPPEVPSWGTILSESRTLLRTAPWQSLYPGLAVSLTVLGINLLGDGLRDLLDPRLKRIG